VLKSALTLWTTPPPVLPKNLNPQNIGDGARREWPQPLMLNATRLMRIAAQLSATGRKHALGFRRNRERIVARSGRFGGIAMPRQRAKIDARIAFARLYRELD